MDQLSSVVDGEEDFIMAFFCLEKCKVLFTLVDPLAILSN